MAREFNITPADKFFLGEDKFIDIVVFGQDDATPLDVSGLPLEWSLKLRDKDPDPGILEKGINPGTGITIIGIYNANPTINTQKVRLTFASAETDPFVTVGYTLKPTIIYRHSLKRRDSGNEGIVSFGSFQFRQATEP